MQVRLLPLLVMRIVSDRKFTIDARWVVIAKWYGDFDSIIFDPSNGDIFLDLIDCLLFVRDNA
jgi:hypothetical protein